MRNVLIRFVFLMLFIGLVMLSAYSRASEESIGGQVSAADFILEDLNGEKIVLSDILKEKKTVLIFWTTWCYLCRKELPQVEKFYRENKDKMAVIGIDIRESKTKVERFVRKLGISYPIALDYDGSVAKLYNVRGVPTIVAVDKDARIMYYGHSIEEMAEKIEF